MGPQRNLAAHACNVRCRKKQPSCEMFMQKPKTDGHYAENSLESVIVFRRATNASGIESGDSYYHSEEQSAKQILRCARNHNLVPPRMPRGGGTGYGQATGNTKRFRQARACRQLSIDCLRSDPVSRAVRTTASGSCWLGHGSASRNACTHVTPVGRVRSLRLFTNGRCCRSIG
jgi:hypothetical protein